MNNKIKTILMAAIMSSVVLTQGVCVSAAQFDDGASAFSDGTGSVSALASTLAKQTEEQTQEFVAKEEEAAQIREERRVEKAEKASEKAEQEKTAALESIQQTVEDTKKKIAEEAEAKRLAAFPLCCGINFSAVFQHSLRLPPLPFCSGKSCFCYSSAAFAIYITVSIQKINACITPENQSK